jgi:hypothetical protein
MCLVIICKFFLSHTFQTAESTDPPNVKITGIQTSNQNSHLIPITLSKSYQDNAINPSLLHPPRKGGDSVLANIDALDKNTDTVLANIDAIDKDTERRGQWGNSGISNGLFTKPPANPVPETGNKLLPSQTNDVVVAAKMNSKIQSKKQDFDDAAIETTKENPSKQVKPTVEIQSKKVTGDRQGKENGGISQHSDNSYNLLYENIKDQLVFHNGSSEVEQPDVGNVSGHVYEFHDKSYMSNNTKNKTFKKLLMI